MLCLFTQELHGNLYQNQDVESTELLIYGYTNRPIPSIERSRRNKDAIFNYILDFKKIQETCESYGLTFSHFISTVTIYWFSYYFEFFEIPKSMMYLT